MLAVLSDRYILPPASALTAEVARRQRARLTRTSAPSPFAASVSRWQHVPLGELFGQAGNRIHTRGDGRQETGHDPAHGSKSGRCVLLDPQTGRWWCRGCRRHGDAATLVMAWRGWTYRQAAQWLTDGYGAPPTQRAPLRPVVEA
jgi:hypothetical protein